MCHKMDLGKEESSPPSANGSLILTQNLMDQMSKVCQSEVKVVFEKLSSLREETHRHVSNIIDSHSCSISRGIEDMVKEVHNLQAELSATRKEKNTLLETIGNLNGEIRQLSAELTIAKPLPAPEETIPLNTQEEDDFINNISKTLEQDEERPRTQKEFNGIEVNMDYEELSEQNVQQQNKQSLNDQKEVTKPKYVCGLCPYETMSKGHLLIHIEGMHEFSVQNVQQHNIQPLIDQVELNVSPADETGDMVVNEEIQADRIIKDKIASQDMEKEFKCELCPYESARRSSLIYHKSSIHKSEELEFKYGCELCHHETISKGHMKAHIKEMHGRIKKYICEYCEYAAFTTGNLQKHKKYYHGSAKSDANKIHQCEKCSYRSAQKSTLNAHFRRAHGNVKNACAECGYACKNKSALEKHTEFVHKLGFPVFKCEHCSYDTYLKKDLMKHIQKVKHFPQSSTA